MAQEFKLVTPQRAGGLRPSARFQRVAARRGRLAPTADGDSVSAEGASPTTSLKLGLVSSVSAKSKGEQQTQSRLSNDQKLWPPIRNREADAMDHQRRGGLCLSSGRLGSGECDISISRTRANKRKLIFLLTSESGVCLPPLTLELMPPSHLNLHMAHSSLVLDWLVPGEL